MDGNIFNSRGIHVAIVRGPTIFDLKGKKLYDLRGINIYKLFWRTGWTSGERGGRR